MYRKRIAVALSTLGLLLMACDGTVVSPEASEAPAFARGGMHHPGPGAHQGVYHLCPRFR